MNGRKARALRQAAQRATVGRPERDYITKQALNNDGAPAVRAFANATPGAPPYLVPSMVTTMDRKCTRSVYKRLKRAYRAAMSYDRASNRATLAGSL